MQKAAQLLFDLGADYPGMFTTLEFINLHSYDLCTFLYQCYTAINTITEDKDP